MLGIFDSGVGGLSVLKKIREKAPQLDVVYFGDTANAPYGIKSQDELKELTGRAVSFLLERGVKNIVSACNSVSAHMTTESLNGLSEKEFGILEMVGPAASALKQIGGDIALVATPATITSGMYQCELEKGGIKVEAHAITDLAGAIENGASRDELRAIIDHALQQVDARSGTLALSCTHYPLVSDIFEEVIAQQGKALSLFDPADAVATEVISRFGSAGNGAIQFFISKDSPVFYGLIQKYFGSNLDTQICEIM